MTGIVLPARGWAGFLRNTERVRTAAALLCIAGSVALAHWTEIGGVLSSDPLAWAAHLGYGLPDGWLPGLPGWNDPNAGITTEALGGLAARDWLHGVVPWWNPYSGVGMPLAAEMQNSALFLPYVLLLHAKNGVALLKGAVEVTAGVACFALLRQLGMRRVVATAGGIAFALNGTFAWMAHGPIMPVPFLPVLLLGIERAAAAARAGRGGGHVWIAIGLAYSLYAGFPETAYLNGILAGCWALLRITQARGGARLALVRKVALGGAGGLLLAAPILLPFLELLASGSVGYHAALAPRGVWFKQITLLLTPYAYGPIAYAGQWVEAGLAGGFLQLGLVPFAILGALGAAGDRGLRRLLAGWALVAVACLIGVPFVIDGIDLLPGLRFVWFNRYVVPSLALCVVVLAAFGLQDWLAGGVARGRLRGAVLAAGVAAGLGMAAGAGHIAALSRLAPNSPLFVVGSVIWASAVLGGIWFLVRERSERRGLVLAGLLAAEAVGLAQFALLAGYRYAVVDRGAVRFLQHGIGLARFYSLGPLCPNYGAYFRVASVNFDYLPTPGAWLDYAGRHVAADPAIALGCGPPLVLPAERIAKLEALGVRYVLVNPGGWAPDAGEAAIRSVYRSAVTEIWELPAPAPYFEVRGGSCRLRNMKRERLEADCAGAATLVRREMAAPGWRAYVGGQGVDLRVADDIFQAVPLPAGVSSVRFVYAPPFIGWAYAAFVLGVVSLGVWERGRAGGGQKP